MPDYFAGYEIIPGGQTKNFLVTCDADPGARQRALSIAQTCESDLARLNDLFSCNFESGNTSPHSIWVVVLADNPSSNANGWNYGYETKQSSRIYIQRAFNPPPASPPPLIPPDPAPLTGPNLNLAMIEFPRFVFVAELAEILMGFTGYGWDAGHSPGEGLSNVLGALLHPAGYYDAGQGPRINQWLNGQATAPVIAPRTDYVTNKLDTDKDIFSYGCAILFLNYLVYQRSYSLKSVIRAGGATLADTFATLTGEAKEAGYVEFNALLQAHVGSATTNSIPRDNIFPLRDIPFRSLEATEAAPIDKGEFTDPHPVSFTLKQGIACRPAAYDYFRHHILEEQPIFVRARGMANARIDWAIAGLQPGSTTIGAWTTVTVATPVTVKNPDGGEVIVANQVTFQYATASAWNSLAVYLKPITWNGNCTLNLTFSAHEVAFPAEAVTTITDDPTLDTVDWIAGAAAAEARRKCNPYYARLNNTFWYLTAALADVKNRPDPGPVESEVAKVVRAVELLQKAVAQYSRAGHLSEAETMHQLQLPGALRSQNAPAAEIDMTRVQLSKRPLAPQNQNREPSGRQEEEKLE